MGVLEAWETWSAYSPAFTERLKATFLRREDQDIIPDFSLHHPLGQATSGSSGLGIHSNVASLTSGTQPSDDERRILRDIETKVTQYMKDLQQTAQTSFGSYRERLSPAQLAKRGQEYREKLLEEWKQQQGNN